MHPFSLYKKLNFAKPQPVEFPSIVKPTTGTPNRLTPVVLMPLGDLMAGDILDIANISCQVTSTMAYNLMVASHVILTKSWRTSPSWSQNDFGDWMEVCEAQTQNITNNVKHFAMNRTGRITMTEDWPNAHLIMLVYAASTAWNGVTDLSVNADYGRCEGTIERAITPQELAEFLAGVPAPAPPAPAPEPPPDSEPEPEFITLQITPAQAAAHLEVAALIQQAGA